ncbi:MAG: hypothetical protein FWD11_01115 [Micrococcales bacterium]|nr:hypothetical protein [Micrococcales bacterium]
MTPKMRRNLFAVSICAAALIATSGCMKIDLSIDIKSDDDIWVSSVLGARRSAVEAQEINADDLCESLNKDDGVTLYAPGLTDAPATDVSDDKYVACKMEGTSNLENMTDNLEHVDGTYVFTMDSSDSSEGVNSSMVDSVEISVTFPGKVLEHNGSSTVSGTTVTWTNPDDMFTPEGLRAVGEDTPSTSTVSDYVLWIAIGVVGLLVIVIIVVVLVVVLLRKGGQNPPPMLPYQPQPYPQPGQTGYPPYPSGPPSYLGRPPMPPSPPYPGQQ